MYQALYFRHSSIGCEQSIEAAIHSAPEDKKEYICREWWSTRHQWAYYARQHSCLLLQCMTKNSVESWHKSVKHHAEGKEAMSKFSLSGAVEHIFSIGYQWELRATKAATIFRTTRTVECAKYPDLALFPGLVQMLIVAQLNKAIKAIDKDKPSTTQLPDNLTCQCQFYRSYQLPCSHIWQYHLFNDVITRQGLRR